MRKGRLEAFSDGVIAIIVTIMVLELKAPHGTDLAALLPLTPVFLGYALSFLVVAIMWVNHHYLFQIVERVDAAIIWCNNLLLFTLSLIPFATAYLGENPTAPLPVALYGFVLTLSALSFTALRALVARGQRDNPELTEQHRQAIRKASLGSLLYASSAALAFVSVYLSFVIFILIPLAYFIPERRLERHAV